jgi:two-component system response regulator GlrR
VQKDKILVVDDDINLLEVIKMRLESADYKVTTASDGESALKAVREQPFNTSIIDLQLDQLDGISLMQDVHQIQPEVPVIILTAYGTIESTVDAMQKGAYSYLTKPFDHRELLIQVEKALKSYRLSFEIKRLKNLLDENYEFDNIIAKSKKMRRILGQVSRIAKTDSTVYILGESGTGKELVAKAIHLASDRRDNPFVAINCAALPETLLESELFGYEKGAFTGALRSTKGLFTQADKGTIFLDEIANMPLSIQAKMLRVLQEQQFFPVGGKKLVEISVRVLVATNKDLKNEVTEGRFREDLYYRVHVIPVNLPPLRERREDIPLLVDHFIHKFRDRMNKKVKGIAPAAMQKLMMYDWPGNIRELENTIEYAMTLTTQDIITDDLILQTAGMFSDVPIPFKEAKANFEKNYLINMLGIAQGNISKASELSGKYRADFYALLKKHDIKPDEFKNTRSQ